VGQLSALAMFVALIPQPEGMKSIQQNARKAFDLRLNIDAAKQIVLDGTRANGNWSVMRRFIGEFLAAKRKMNDI
jgi:hypothetical protein